MRRRTHPLASIFVILAALAIVYPLIGIPLIIITITLICLWYKKFYKIRVETLKALIALTPSKFERAMATLLEDLGYQKVRVTGGAGDLSRDIT